MKETKRTDREPRKHREDGHAPVASILCGYPQVTDALQERRDSGRVVLGGCVVEPGAPRWTCTKCDWREPPRKVDAVDIES